VKTGVPILVSFVMGTLVVLALNWNGSGARAAEPAASAASAPVRVVADPAATARAATLRAPHVAPAVRLNLTSPARISIPHLHLKLDVGKNVDAGPAWWPVTGRPGGGDTIAIAGHRTTHTHPFLDLDVLEPGDAIFVRWEGVPHRYLVTGRRVVSNRQGHLADARGHEVLILSTCTPKGSSRQRLLVYARPDAADHTPAS
jgi:LPXTG-site transpeptidase (sortase) family protein